MIIWALIDPRPGTGNQALAVAEAWGKDFIKKPLQYNKLADAPNALLWLFQALFKVRCLNLDDQAALDGPGPDWIIASGRKAAFTALYLKKFRYPQARIVQIMDPKWRQREFDVLAVPSHDDCTYQGFNLLRTDGNPHRVTPANLAAAKTEFAEILAHLPKRRIALLLGGPVKDGGLDEDLAVDLLRATSKAAMAWQAGVMISTSRRTPDAIVGKLPYIMAAPNVVHHWRHGGKNPYLGYLAYADVIIVSADSTAMISEALATGKPCFIFAPHGMVSGKQLRFIESLFRNNLADPFDGQIHFEQPANTLANPANAIVDAVHNRFGA